MHYIEQYISMYRFGFFFLVRCLLFWAGVDEIFVAFIACCLRAGNGLRYCMLLLELLLHVLLLAPTKTRMVAPLAKVCNKQICNKIITVWQYHFLNNNRRLVLYGEY